MHDPFVGMTTVIRRTKEAPTGRAQLAAFVAFQYHYHRS